MAFTPCPCMDLQKGVKILAIVDIVLSCIALVLTAIGLAAVLSLLSTAEKQNNEIQAAFDNNDFQFQHNNNFREVKNTATTLIVVIAAIVLVLILLQLVLAIVLYTGASKRLQKRCQVWLVITIILTVLNFLSLFGGGSIPMTLVRVIYSIYQIVVVVYFLKELKGENNSHA